MLKLQVLFQKVACFPKSEKIEQKSLFPFVSLHYKDCENVFLSWEVAFLPSSKHLTSLHIYQTNVGSFKLGTRE